ncbi:MAG: hypothetical protein ACI4BD_02950 [Paludibacteraceae bacterium]
MKKIFTLLTALLCTVAQMAWAEDCPALNEAGEKSYSAAGGGSVEYTLSGEGYAVTFEAYKTMATAVGDGVILQEYVNNSWQKVADVSIGDLSKNSYKAFGPYTISRAATKIRFYSSGSYSRYIRNVYVTRATYVDAPADGTLTFDTKKVNSETGKLSTTILWGNTSALSVTISGTGAAQFAATISDNATTCTNGTATITVTYAHNVVGSHSATLTLTNGDFTHTIALNGVTEKKDQYIVWGEDYTGDQITLPVGKEVSDAATATSGNSVIYSSSDESIVAITNDGASFKALKAGEATLTATQAGDDTEWNAVSETKTVVVTNKKIQSILWTDNLSRLKVGGEDVPLTAIVRILTINGDEETYEESSIRTALLKYSSGDESVVKVNNLTKTLTIVGEGTTTVTASVDGDLFYEAASVTMPVKVRAASALCEGYVLDDAEERTLNTIDNETYQINGPASQLIFTANRTKLVGFSGGNLKADVYYDGGWHNIFDESVPLEDYQTYGPYSIPRNSTQVKFYTETGATGYKHVKDVAVTMAQYLETTTPSITVEKSIIGDAVACTASIQYSNLPDEVPVTNNSSHIILADDNLGNVCGEFGEKTIHFTAYPTAIGEIRDTLVISEPLTGLNLRIPVLVKTQRNTQTIIWEDALSNILTTDQITLTASAQTTISYSSSDETIAYVNAANELVIVKAGEVTITATAAQDEKYEEATLSKTVTIALATPQIITAPTLTVESVGYGEALTNDMLTGGEADVEGTFTWNIPEDADYLPGTHNVPVLFVPTNSDWYATAETTVSVVVTKMAQTIVWDDVIEGLSIRDTVYLTASAKTEVTYSVDKEEIAVVEGNKLYFLAGGTVVVTATAAESELYYEATAEKTIVLGRVKATITNAPIAADTLVYGQALGEVELIDGEATCAGHFEWAEPDMVQIAGDYWMKAVFIPEDADAFEGDTCDVYIHIGIAEQEIIWDFQTSIISVGDQLVLDATATSGYAVIYELDPTDIATLEGNTLTAIATGTLIITAQQDGVDEDGNQNYYAAAPVSFTITIAKSSTDNGLIITEVRARKAVRNGEVVIIRGEEIYNMRGQRVE